MTVYPLPGNVSFGTVTGRIRLAVGDSGDPGTSPEAMAATGSVTFTPSPARMISLSSSTIFIPKPIVVTLDTLGEFTVDLIATDDTDLNPVDWTYGVKFNLDGAQLDAFDIQVPGGSTQDISAIVPLDSSPGVLTIRGDPGITVSADAPVDPYMNQLWLDIP